MNKEKLLKVIIDNKLGKELAQLLYDTTQEAFALIQSKVKVVGEELRISIDDFERLKKSK